MSQATTRCQHDGCEREGFECRMSGTCLTIDGEEKDLSPEYYCGEHAPDAGYCRCCREFWGGIESFEFLHPGLCDQCYDAIQADSGDFDDDGSADPWDGDDVP